MKKKVITSAILTIALAFSLLLGATYALFTSESRIQLIFQKVEAVDSSNKTIMKICSGLKHSGDVELVIK